MKTILVVDDDPDIREVVKTILERNGFKAISAVNGDDCLKKLKAKKVDLILLDIMMPGTPIRNVIKKIRGTKIIFLTVVRTSEAEKESLLKNKNVASYVQKPFMINELIGEVKRVLEE